MSMVQAVLGLLPDVAVVQFDGLRSRAWGFRVLGFRVLGFRV